MKKLAQAIGLALALGALPAAHGAATLFWQFDADPIESCADGDVCDLNTDPGIVTISDDIGTYNVTIVGVSKPAVTGDPLMDLGFVIISGSSDDHTLIFAFSDTDFTLEGTLSAEIGGTINGAGNTLEAAAFCDPNNTLLQFATLIGSFGPAVAGAFADSSGAVATCTTPYSVTQVIFLETTDTGVISGDFALSGHTVPAPGTLALIGLGLAGFAAFRRRRQK
jgi:hypothetical protein